MDEIRTLIGGNTTDLVPSPSVSIFPIFTIMRRHKTRKKPGRQAYSNPLLFKSSILQCFVMAA